MAETHDGATAKRPRRAKERRNRGRRAEDSAPLDGAARIEHGAIVVTGICGRLGRRLARQLHRERRVIGLDRREFALLSRRLGEHVADIIASA